jgi:tol-pal system protein YbgF
MTVLRRLLIAGAGAAALAFGAFSAGAPAMAQTAEDRRLDRLEKDLHELRAIVFQGRDTGQPVVVKPEGPDPAVEALQGRVDQLEQTLRNLSGQVEVLSHDLDEAKRQGAAAHDAEVELRGEVKALTDEMHPQVPADGSGAAPPPAGSAAPEAQAGAAPAAPPGSGEAASFRAAKALLAGGDYAGAADALNAYLQQYGSSPHAREAYYLLGESYYIRGAYGDATTAYARSLKDWPKLAWAPDATVKLARALASTSRVEQGCAALAEFQRRYGATASRAVRARAAATAASAKCPG